MSCNHCHRPWIIGGDNLGVFRFKDWDEKSSQEIEVAYCTNEDCLNKAIEHKIIATHRRIKAGTLCGHVDEYEGALPCIRESTGRHLGCKYHPAPKTETLEPA